MSPTQTHPQYTDKMGSLTWKSQQDSPLLKRFHTSMPPTSPASSPRPHPINLCLIIYASKVADCLWFQALYHRHVVSHLCAFLLLLSTSTTTPIAGRANSSSSYTPLFGEMTEVFQRATLTHAFTWLILSMVPFHGHVHASPLHLPHCPFIMYFSVIFLWRVTKYATPKDTTLA